MSLRAEISVMDDDENVVGIVKVPLFERDVMRHERGPFAENLVTDPGTGEVYKFTFQADVVGQIAPKREEVATPKVGDIVRIVGNTSSHHFRLDDLAEVEEVFDGGMVQVGRADPYGGFSQTLFRDDYILE